MEDVYSDKHQLGFQRVYEPQKCERQGSDHTTKKGPHYHWILSGHCMAGNPEALHKQCKGSYGANSVVVNCICYCHHLDRQPRKPGTLRRPARKATVEPPKAKVIRRVKAPVPTADEAPPEAPRKSVRRIRPR